MSNILPDQFSTLEPFSTKWALSTESKRQQERIHSTPGDLKAFYDAIMPQMEEVLSTLDQHPYGQLPEGLHPLYWMSLSLAEVAPHVELYKGSNHVPFSFEEARFEAEHGNQINI